MNGPSDATRGTFRPPGEHWTRVSGRLAVAQRITAVAVGAVFVAMAFLVSLFEPLAGRIGAGVVVLGVLWSWWLIGRRVRALGYAERADDLLVVSGVLFRRLVVVPYGRMQLVDVTAGPLERALGVTSVQLHTAAATTDAVIPGLEPDEAARLRDRLAELGELRSAGL